MSEPKADSRESPSQVQGGGGSASGATGGDFPPLEGFDTAAGLHYFLGRTAAYRRSLIRFRDESCADFPSRFREAVEAQDWAGAHRHAHTLKGAARLLGAVRLGDLSEALEASAAQGAQPPIDTLFREVREEIHHLLPPLGALGPREAEARAPPAPIAPRETVLVVDDDPRSLGAMREALSEGYRVLVANRGEDALEIARDQRPGLVLLDVLMPGMDGYLVCHALKTDPRTRDIPVVFISANAGEIEEQAGLEMGAVDYIRKPASPSLVRHRVRIHLDLHGQSLALEERVRERTRELEHTQLEILHGLARASVFREDGNAAHLVRISEMAHALALAVGVPEAQAGMLLHAVPLHDVGKIGIPDAILRKAGRLDEAERQVMERHTRIGVEIIGSNSAPIMRLASEVALHHHERWDGTGYPNRLSGEAIPLMGRITAIADVFDALLSGRRYRAAWSVEEAFAYVRSNAGTAFDPTLAGHFVALREKILGIRAAHPDIQAS